MTDSEILSRIAMIVLRGPEDKILLRVADHTRGLAATRHALNEIGLPICRNRCNNLGFIKTIDVSLYVAHVRVIPTDPVARLGLRQGLNGLLSDIVTPGWQKALLDPAQPRFCGACFELTQKQTEAGTPLDPTAHSQYESWPWFETIGYVSAHAQG